MNVRMTVPAQRLTAADLYDYVDLTEKAFMEEDEFEVERDGRLRLVLRVDYRMRQLIGVINHMRDPHYSLAMEQVDALKRARISRSVDLPEVFTRLRHVISSWDAAHEARRRAA